MQPCLSCWVRKNPNNEASRQVGFRIGLDTEVLSNFVDLGSFRQRSPLRNDFLRRPSNKAMSPAKVSRAITSEEIVGGSSWCARWGTTNDGSRERYFLYPAIGVPQVL